jgi:hypothetical protein
MDYPISISTYIIETNSKTETVHPIKDDLLLKFFNSFKDNEYVFHIIDVIKDKESVKSPFYYKILNFLDEEKYTKDIICEHLKILTLNKIENETKPITKLLEYMFKIENETKLIIYNHITHLNLTIYNILLYSKNEYIKLFRHDLYLLTHRQVILLLKNLNLKPYQQQLEDALLCLELLTRYKKLFYSYKI